MVARSSDVGPQGVACKRVGPGADADGLFKRSMMDSDRILLTKAAIAFRRQQVFVPKRSAATHPARAVQGPGARLVETPRSPDPIMRQSGANCAERQVTQREFAEGTEAA